MHRFVSFLVCFVLVVKGEHSQDIERCITMGKYEEECCKYEISEETRVLYDECLKKTHSSESCDFHVCLGKTNGFLRPNGTFDKIALEEILEKDFENDTDVSDFLKEKCLSEELDAYIREDPCYLKELGNCLSFYAMTTCKNWTESDECKKVKTDVEECQKLLP